MTAVFVDRLHALDAKAKAGLAASLEAGSQPAFMRSAFELPATQRAILQKAVNEAFSTEVRLSFETAPDLVSGIELTTGGQKLAWSIADYLVSLEMAVGDLLKEKGEPEAKAAPGAATKPAQESP
jgi:F-type H+-transporting ATPase subunit b